MFQDVNDNSPQFDNTTYHLSVAEDAANGMFMIILWIFFTRYHWFVYTCKTGFVPPNTQTCSVQSPNSAGNVTEVCLQRTWGRRHVGTLATGGKGYIANTSSPHMTGYLGWVHPHWGNQVLQTMYANEKNVPGQPFHFYYVIYLDGMRQDCDMRRLSYFLQVWM